MQAVQTRYAAGHVINFKLINNKIAYDLHY